MSTIEAQQVKPTERMDDSMPARAALNTCSFIYSPCCQSISHISIRLPVTLIHLPVTQAVLLLAPPHRLDALPHSTSMSVVKMEELYGRLYDLVH